MLCLNALWDIGEGNVEEVRRLVSRGHPLAYTTVLTLLDRLTRRGAVTRRKEGRGFRYQPIVERDKLRRIALKQFLEYHFENSIEKLKSFLETPGLVEEPAAAAPEPPPQAVATFVGAPAPVVPEPRPAEEHSE